MLHFWVHLHEIYETKRRVLYVQGEAFIKLNPFTKLTAQSKQTSALWMKYTISASISLQTDKRVTGDLPTRPIQRESGPRRRRETTRTFRGTETST
jgi:hypothetical protein